MQMSEKHLTFTVSSEINAPPMLVDCKQSKLPSEIYKPTKKVINVLLST